jgi:transcriptional regulator with GAF, ATPase, and Fis domain
MWRDILKQRVDALRDEFLATTDELVATQEHVQVLLSAVLSLTEDVGLEVILQRVTAFACKLACAQHAALDVVDDGQSVSRFVTASLDAGQQPSRARIPAGSPPLTAVLNIPIPIHQRVFGTLHLTEKAGGDGFSDEDNTLCVALAAAAGVAIENARHSEANARRRQWLEAGVEASEQILVAGSGGPEILAIIAEQARAASGSALALVAFFSADGQRLLCQAAEGLRVFAPGQEVSDPSRNGRRPCFESPGGHA